MTESSVQTWTAQFTATRPSSRPTIEAYAKQLSAQNRITLTVQEALHQAKKAQLEYDVIFYIAGALTRMSDEVKGRYADVSYLVGSYHKPKTMFGYAPHLYGTDPVKHPDITPQEVHDIDYLWATIVPDGHLNFWIPVAHGNAIEAAWAEQYNIPSLYVVPTGVTLSRLVRGMRNIIGTLTYADFHLDGLPQIQQFLNEISQTSTE